MKYRFFVFFFISFISLQICKAEKAKEDLRGQFLQHRKDKEDKKLQSILYSFPEVEAKEKKCKIELGGSKSISECIWKDLPPEVKTKIQLVISAGEEASKEEGKLGKYALKGPPLKKYQHKGFDNLRDYYAKKLNQVLYGSDEGIKKAKQHVDHQQFYQLQKTNLSQNIIMSISSFCLDAVAVVGQVWIKEKEDFRPARLFFIISDKENLKKIRNKRLERLADEENLKDQMTKSNTGSDDYTKCVKGIQMSCYGFNINSTETKTAKEYVEANGQERTNFEDITLADANGKSTTERACEVVRYLKDSRVSLQALDKIQEGFDALDTNSNFPSGFQEDSKIYNGSVYRGQDNNKLVTIASSDFENESQFEEGRKEALNDFEKCAQVEEGNVEVRAEDKCKQFLSSKEETEKLNLEATIRAEAQLSKVKKNLNGDDPKKYAEYLKSEGFSDEQIKESFIDPESIKEEIIKRYEIEKENLIASLKKKTDSKTIGATINDETSHKRLGDIYNELSTQTKNYTQLLKYNNVVSAFLQVGEGDKKSRNTAALKIELNPNSSGRGTASGEEGATPDIARAAKRIGLHKGSDDSSNTGATLGVKEINTGLLRYDSDSSKREKKDER